MAGGHWSSTAGCQKIWRGGVLPVDGDDLAKHAVLKLSEMPETGPSSPTSGSAADNRFDLLFGRFYPELFALVYRVLGDRMETEDTLQETFLKLSDGQAWSHLEAQPDAALGAWLRRVALNLAFNRVRSARRAQARLERVGRLERMDDDAVDNELAGPSAAVVRLEERAAVRRALAEVPERQRECLLLRHSGYSYAEIAETLGIAVGSVGVLLARAEHAFRTTYRRQTPA
jgi:RNA polymerase sigma factor (sigma-70 family)